MTPERKDWVRRLVWRTSIVALGGVLLYLYLRFVWFRGPTIAWARHGQEYELRAAHARPRAPRPLLSLDAGEVAGRPPPRPARRLGALARRVRGVARAWIVSAREDRDDVEGVHGVPGRRLGVGAGRRARGCTGGDPGWHRQQARGRRRARRHLCETTARGRAHGGGRRPLRLSGTSRSRTRRPPPRLRPRRSRASGSAPPPTSRAPWSWPTASTPPATCVAR